METAIAIVVAVLTAAVSFLRIAYMRQSESRERLLWDLREKKIPVYARCLSAIGPMVGREIERQDRQRGPSPSVAPTATPTATTPTDTATHTPTAMPTATPTATASQVMAEMANWASSEAYLSYILVGFELKKDLPDVNIFLPQLTDLIQKIRKDLGHEDIDWVKEAGDAIGYAFVTETLPAQGTIPSNEASEDNDS